MDIIDKLNHGVSEPEAFLRKNASGLAKFTGHYQLLLLGEQGEHDALTDEGKETLDVAKEKLLQYYIHDALACVKTIPIITITANIKFSSDISLMDIYPLLSVDENFKVGLGDTYRDGHNFTNIEQEKKVFNNQVKMIIKHGGRSYNMKLFCRNIHMTGVKSSQEIDSVANLILEKILQVRNNLRALRLDKERSNLRQVLSGQVDPSNPIQIFLQRQLHEFGSDTSEEGINHMDWLYNICLEDIVADDFSLREPEIVMVKRNFSMGFPVQCQYFYQRFLTIPGFFPCYEKTIHNDLSINIPLCNYSAKIKESPRISLTICANGTVSTYASYVADENDIFRELTKLFIYSRQFYSEILEKRLDMAVELLDNLRFPVRLYKRDQKGKMRLWEIDYEETENGYAMLSRHGQLDGKIQESAPTYIRTNKSGRNPWQQLMLRVNAEIKKKRDAGYTADGSFSPDYKGCQLAVDWQGGVKRKDFPVWVQPKCDGLRGLAWLRDGQVEIYSRKGLPYEYLGHVREKLRPILQKLPANCGIDGELFVKDVPLQKLTSWVRTAKVEHPCNRRLCYYIFDVICSEKMSLNQRATLLKNITAEEDVIWLEFAEIRKVPESSVVALDWLVVRDEEELRRVHELITGPDYGYEGLMIRWPQEHCDDRTYYKCGRNNHLAKYKTFQEMEGKIIDICGGEGKDAELAIFTLQLADNKQITCRPAVSDEKRHKYFQRKEKYMGRQYTFKFFSLSQDGVPLFPVGKAFRHDI